MPKRLDTGDYKKISHADFEKLQLRVGTITDIKKHPKNPKDYTIIVDCAASDEDIQVVAALADSYKMEELLGKQVAVLCNITPESIGGIESCGMLLCTHIGKKKILLTTDKKTPPGTEISGIMNGECVHFSERDH